MLGADTIPLTLIDDHYRGGDKEIFPGDSGTTLFRSPKFQGGLCFFRHVEIDGQPATIYRRMAVFPAFRQYTW